MFKKEIFFLIFIFFISCQTKNKTEDKFESSIQIDSTKVVVSGIGVTLDNEVKQKLNDWVEYQEVDKIISKYQKISINDALTTSVELVNSVKMLNDSIRIEELKIDEFKTRLAVLYNESLRLKDMSTIPSIKSEEVNQEIKNILNSFSAINSKINTVFIKNKFEKEEVD